jgi:hypothetical protein
VTASTARPSRPLALLAWVAVGVLLLLGGPIATSDLPSLTQCMSYAAVGGFLAIRRPDNAIGWLLIAIGFAFVGTSIPSWFDVAALQAGSAAPQHLIWAWFTVWSGGAVFLLYAAIAMTFPSGHLPSGRWRPACIAALAAGVVAIGLPAFVHTLVVSPDGVTQVRFPNPLAVLPDLSPEFIGVGQVLVTLVPMVVLAAAVVGLIARYRRAAGIVRLQIRWLLASMTFLVIAIVFGLAIFVASDATTGYAWIPALVAYPLVPLAVGVAVMRYRLFEIDRIISRTIAYGAVSAILFAVYAGVTLLLQGALGSAVGESALAVAVSTLVVAALFNPLRIRMQRVVDRRFNRSRYDQERAVEAFTAGLRDEVDVERLVGHIRSAVSEAVQPTALEVWQRRREDPT